MMAELNLSKQNAPGISHQEKYHSFIYFFFYLKPPSVLLLLLANKEELFS
jgi:hypothetical protein